MNDFIDKKIILDKLFKYMQNSNECKFCIEKIINPKNQSCKGNIVKAHSISNKSMLKSIENNGHVYLLQPSINGEMLFKKVGISKATTFKGYCSHHDTQIYKVLDNISSITIINNEICNLLNLRATAQELYKKIITKQFFQEKIILIEKIQIDNDYRIEFVKGIERAICDLNIIYKKLKEKNFFPYSNFSLNSNNIACTGIFSPTFNHKGDIINTPDQYLVGDNLNYLFIHVIPINGKSEVILSAEKKEVLNYYNFNGFSDKNIFISKLILNNIENYCFSPQYFESLDSEIQKYIKDISQDTVLLELPHKEIKDIDFFSP